ncbi:MAG: ABC transporter substrate-binding protein [Treponema sp.]|jgi:peptide/nickel transport system substrate-binding protein|nr:ABC transporter substrate-binding protein [Treponema sp.]
MEKKKQTGFGAHAMYVRIGLVLMLLVSCAIAGYARGSQAGRGASSATSTSTGGELRIGVTSEPATLDPLSSANTADGRSILFNVYEGLVKPSTDAGWNPAVAESYTVEQAGLVYNFKLRAGVKFHDGTTLTAEDVVFTLNKAADARFNGFTQIAKVEALDDNDVERVLITLHEPNVEFLPYLTLGIVPRNNPDREAKPLGTGPYSIVSYTTQQSLVLEKNPYYWQAGIPHLDKITYIFAADSDALLTALQGGNIDGASVTGALVDQLNPSQFDLVQSPSNAVQMLALNNAIEPLNDVRVRKALNYAVDVQEIIDIAFYGRGTPSGSPIIPGLSRYYETSLANPYPVNIDTAKTLLAEAGYPDGFPLEITVPSNYTMHVDTAQVLVNQLAKVGVETTIRQVDWATWLTDVYRGRQYQATVISLDASVMSPRGFLDRYRSSASSNFVSFQDPTFDQVYGEAITEVDEAKRSALYKESQRIISDNAVSVYLQDITEFKAFRKGFAGFVSYPLYVFDVSTIYRTR